MIKDKEVKFLFVVLIFFLIVYLFNFSIQKISGREGEIILTISSEIYIISNNGNGNETISGVPEGVNRDEFLRLIQKNDERQVWDDRNIQDPVRQDDILIVTPEDRSREVIYSIIIGQIPEDNSANISSDRYTLSDEGNNHWIISGIRPETSLADFLSSLTKEDENQTWNYENINDPVRNNNQLIVTSSRGDIVITYDLILEEENLENIISIETLSTSSVTQNSAVLNGVVSQTNNENLSLGFEYGLNTEYGETIEVISTQENESYSLLIDNLNCENTYHYRSYVTTDSQETLYGDDYIFTTLNCSGGRKISGSLLMGFLFNSPRETISKEQETKVNISTSEKSVLNGNKSDSLNRKTENIQKSVLETNKILKMQNTTTKDDDVLKLQTYLNNHGYYDNLKIDGIFGNQTKQAVINFQKANGLKVDGIVGPQTKALLK